MWYEREGEWIVMRIKAVPGSGKNQIVGLLDEALKIRIKAPAVEGAANKELVKFLAKEFKLSKSDVVFVSGQTSKQKRLKMPYNAKIADLIDRLEKEQ